MVWGRRSGEPLQGVRVPGLLPAGMGRRHETKKLANMKMNEKPIMNAPTVETSFQLCQPILDG